MAKNFKRILLYLFCKVFEKELEDVEPEVDKFFANLLRPYIGE